MLQCCSITSKSKTANLQSTLPRERFRPQSSAELWPETKLKDRMRHSSAFCSTLNRESRGESKTDSPTPRKLLDTAREASALPKNESDSSFLDSQVPVFHFPGVVKSVKRSVPNQEPQRPFRHLARHLALRVVFADSIAISFAVRSQSLGSE